MHTGVGKRPAPTQGLCRAKHGKRLSQKNSFANRLRKISAVAMPSTGAKTVRPAGKPTAKYGGATIAQNFFFAKCWREMGSVPAG